MPTVSVHRLQVNPGFRRVPGRLWFSMRSVLTSVVLRTERICLPQDAPPVSLMMWAAQVHTLSAQRWDHGVCACCICDTIRPALRPYVWGVSFDKRGTSTSKRIIFRCSRSKFAAACTVNGHLGPRKATIGVTKRLSCLRRVSTDSGFAEAFPKLAQKARQADARVSLIHAAAEPL